MMLTNDESLSAEEKIKKLVGTTEAKRKELEEKKQEFENKKRELEELEAARKKEIGETQQKIEEQIEEMTAEEQRDFEEMEEVRRKKEARQASLEETIESEGKTNNTKGAAQQKPYGQAVEEILRGNPTFYDLTDYNVMNRLEGIADSASTRPLTENEKQFVELVQYHAEKFGRSDDYRNKDESNYLSRELAKIELISRMAKDSNKMKGDYQI